MDLKRDKNISNVQNRLRTGQQGMTLVSVLMGAALLGIVVLGATKALQDHFALTALIENRNETNAIRLQLGTGIDCRATLDVNATDSLPTCNLSGIYIKGDSGANFLLGSGVAGTGAFANAYHMGNNWWVKARCGTPTGAGPASNQSLIIEVAKRNPNSNQFARHPITKSAMNFSPIFGGVGQIALCREYFVRGGKVTDFECPDNEPDPSDDMPIVKDVGASMDKYNCTKATSQNIMAAAINNSKMDVDVVDTQHIADSNVNARVIKDRSVLSNHIAPNTFDANKIQSASVDTTKIADSSVMSADILNYSLGKSDFDNSALESRHLATGAVATVDLANGAVENRHIQPDAISRNHFLGQNLRAEDFASESIDNFRVEWYDLTSSRIRDGSIQGIDFGYYALRTEHVYPSSVTFDKIWWLWDSSDFALGILSSDHIARLQITPQKLGIICQHREYLKWNASLNTWECAPRPRVMISAASFHATGGSLYNKPPHASMLDIHIPPPDGSNIWSIAFRPVWNAPSNSWINLDFIGCDRSQGWEIVSCSVYSTDLFTPAMLRRHQYKPMTGVPIIENNVTWFDRDADLNADENGCHTNDIDQAYTGLVNPDFLLNYPTWFYRMYAVCMKVE